jgi:hypothetical protein
MKRIISTIVLLTIASASALGAGSSSSSPVSIGFIVYSNTGIVTVYVGITPGTNAPLINIPACVAAGNIGNTYDYVFDSTTPAGKSMLAGLIASQVAGTVIWISGTGDCAVVAGNETLSRFTQT